MTEKGTWEEIREHLLHPERVHEAHERKEEEARRGKARGEALHPADQSSGSETLDD